MHVADNPSSINAITTVATPYWRNSTGVKTIGPRIGEYAHVGRFDTVRAPPAREETRASRARTYDGRITYKRVPLRKSTAIVVDKEMPAKKNDKTLLQTRSSFKKSPRRRSTRLTSGRNKKSISSSPSIQSLIESVISEAPSRTPSEKRTLNRFTKDLRSYIQVQRSMPPKIVPSRPLSRASATTEVTVKTVQALKPFHEEFKSAGLAVTRSEQRMKGWMEAGRNKPALPIKRSVEELNGVVTKSKIDKDERIQPWITHNLENGESIQMLDLHSGNADIEIEIPPRNPSRPNAGNIETKKHVEDQRSQAMPITPTAAVAHGPTIPPRPTTRKTLAWIRRPDIGNRASSVLKSKSSNVQVKPCIKLPTAGSQSLVKSRPQIELMTESFPLFDPEATPNVEVTAPSSPLVNTESSSPVIYFDTPHEPWENVQTMVPVETMSRLTVPNHEAAHSPRQASNKQAKEETTAVSHRKKNNAALNTPSSQISQHDSVRPEKITESTAVEVDSSEKTASICVPPRATTVTKYAKEVVAELSSIFERPGTRRDTKMIRVPSELLQKEPPSRSSPHSQLVAENPATAMKEVDPVVLQQTEEEYAKDVLAPQSAEIPTISASVRPPEVVAAKDESSSSASVPHHHEVPGRASLSIGIPRRNDAVSPFSPPSKHSTPRPVARSDFLQHSIPTLKRVRAHKCTSPSLVNCTQCTPNRAVSSMRAFIEDAIPRQSSLREVSTGSAYHDVPAEAYPRAEDRAMTALLASSPAADPMKKHSPPPPSSIASTPIRKPSRPRCKSRRRRVSKPRLPSYPTLPSLSSLSTFTTTSTLDSSHTSSSSTTHIFLGLHVASAAACDPDVDRFIKDVTGLEVRRFLTQLSAFEGAGIEALRKVARRAGREERRSVRGWDRARQQRMRKRGSVE